MNEPKIYYIACQWDGFLISEGPFTFSAATDKYRGILVLTSRSKHLSGSYFGKGFVQSVALVSQILKLIFYEWSFKNQKSERLLHANVNLSTPKDEGAIFFYLVKVFKGGFLLKYVPPHPPHFWARVDGPATYFQIHSFFGIAWQRTI